MDLKKLIFSYIRSIESGSTNSLETRTAISYFLKKNYNKKFSNNEADIRRLFGKIFGTDDEKILDIFIQSLYYFGKDQKPTLFESVISTARLRDILGSILPKIKKVSGNIVLGGSLSYSPYFNVRGIRYDSIIKTGETNNNPSDIDLFILLKSFEDLKKIKTYLKKHLKKSDNWHIDNFVKNHSSGDYDYFQFKIKIEGIDVSLEFCTEDTIKKLINCTGDYVTVYSGTYSADLIRQSDLFINYDLTGKKSKENFDLKDKTKAVGSGSLIFLPLSSNESKRFYPDAIIRAYFMPQVTILSDKGEKIKKIRSKVDGIIKKHLPKKGQFRLLRWERMPEYFKCDIINKFYKK
ncbi:MAG TPA: hypothetical protein PKA60_02920 [Candidatus Paceibacterota bacterium]|nr:hypothetical protein [Candidatus Paceibacterota bacterium]